MSLKKTSLTFASAIWFHTLFFPPLLLEYRTKWAKYLYFPHDTKLLRKSKNVKNTNEKRYRRT